MGPGVNTTVQILALPCKKHFCECCMEIRFNTIQCSAHAIAKEVHYLLLKRVSLSRAFGYKEQFPLQRTVWCECTDLTMDRLTVLCGY